MAVPYSSTNNLPFGGKTLTINNVAYRALNWKPEKTTRKIRRDDTNGDQAEVMFRAEPTAQTGLTLQLATSTTAVPPLGVVFSESNDNYVVTAAGKAEPLGEFHVVDISIESTTLPTS